MFKLASGHLFVLGILILHLSVVLIFDFGIVPKVWCLLFVFLFILAGV